MNSFFDEHYQSLWGERWPALREALVQPVQLLARRNGFVSWDDADKPAGFWANLPYDEILCGEAGSSLEPQASSGLNRHYFMDGASFFPPALLGVKPGMSVLDLCAAPGGKSLILAEALQGQGRLVLNEFSRDRFFRLRKVFEDYVPSSGDWAEFMQRDGTTLGVRSRDKFDRILLDAPCSSERHLLHDPRYLKDWKVSRCKTLAQKQYALLCSAGLLLEEDGQIMYSTCSIAAVENDAVVERFCRKKHFQPMPLPVGPGEATAWGVQILPDQDHRMGPLYLSLLRRS